MLQICVNTRAGAAGEVNKADKIFGWDEYDSEYEKGR